MLGLVQALDRGATRLARGILAWSARRAAPSRRGWIVAMRHDLHEVDGGWARLALAVDGLRVVYLSQAPGEQPRHEWPESWCIVAGGLLLALLAWIAFATHVPDLERSPAELIFCFLTLYFYSAGFLSGRRTGQVGKGSWAGAAGGFAFGVAVCGHMIAVSFVEGPHTTIMYGGPNQVAIAWTGVVFFLAMGAILGALGARMAIWAQRQGL